MEPNGLSELARATLIAVVASAPNPRASVNGWPGVVSTSAVCVTLPSAAVWYWLTSRWLASSWASPSLGVPAKPLVAARNGRLASTAPVTWAANGPLGGCVSADTRAVVAESMVASLAPAFLVPPPPVLSMVASQRAYTFRPATEAASPRSGSRRVRMTTLSRAGSVR